MEKATPSLPEHMHTTPRGTPPSADHFLQCDLSLKAPSRQPWPPRQTERRQCGARVHNARGVNGAVGRRVHRAIDVVDVEDRVDLLRLRGGEDPRARSPEKYHATAQAPTL